MLTLMLVCKRGLLCLFGVILMVSRCSAATIARLNEHDLAKFLDSSPMSCVILREPDQELSLFDEDGTSLVSLGEILITRSDPFSLPDGGSLHSVTFPYAVCQFPQYDLLNVKRAGGDRFTYIALPAEVELQREVFWSAIPLPARPLGTAQEAIEFIVDEIGPQVKPVVFALFDDGSPSAVNQFDHDWHELRARHLGTKRFVSLPLSQFRTVARALEIVYYPAICILEQLHLGVTSSDLRCFVYPQEVDQLDFALFKLDTGLILGYRCASVPDLHRVCAEAVFDSRHWLLPESGGDDVVSGRDFLSSYEAFAREEHDRIAEAAFFAVDAAEVKLDPGIFVTSTVKQVILLYFNGRLSRTIASHDWEYILMEEIRSERESGWATVDDYLPPDIEPMSVDVFDDADPDIVVRTLQKPEEPKVITWLNRNDYHSVRSASTISTALIFAVKDDCHACALAADRVGRVRYRYLYGVDCDNEPDVCEELGVTGFPALVGIRFAEERVYYAYFSGSFSSENLETFVATIAAGHKECVSGVPCVRTEAAEAGEDGLTQEDMNVIANELFGRLVSVWDGGVDAHAGRICFSPSGAAEDEILIVDFVSESPTPGELCQPAAAGNESLDASSLALHRDEHFASLPSGRDCLQAKRRCVTLLREFFDLHNRPAFQHVTALSLAESNLFTQRGNPVIVSVVAAGHGFGKKHRVIIESVAEALYHFPVSFVWTREEDIRAFGDLCKEASPSPDRPGSDPLLCIIRIHPGYNERAQRMPDISISDEEFSTQLMEFAMDFES